MRSAFDQFVSDAGTGRRLTDSEDNTKLGRLRSERPELFLTKEERDEITLARMLDRNHAPTRAELFDDMGTTGNLLVGAPAPLLTEEGRAIRRKETQKAASKKYRDTKKLLKKLEAEAAREQQHYENTTRTNPDKRTPGDDGRPAPTTGRDEGAIPPPDPAP